MMDGNGFVSSVKVESGNRLLAGFFSMDGTSLMSRAITQ